jgi:ribosomal protein L37AE/L43A
MSVEQLLQLSICKATLKQKLNSSEIHTTEGFPTCHNKLNPFPFGSRIGLSARGGIPWKCRECAYPWVRATSTGVLTIWHCEKCNAQRLAKQRKSDQQLIAELLNHPRLSSFERTFIQTHSERLGVWQRKRIEGFARRLGISLECNCSLSNFAGVKS